MSFLAAVLLLNLPSPYEAFTCLANLLNRPVLHSLYCGDLGQKVTFFSQIDVASVHVLSSVSEASVVRIMISAKVFIIYFLCAMTVALPAAWSDLLAVFGKRHTLGFAIARYIAVCTLLCF